VAEARVEGAVALARVARGEDHVVHRHEATEPPRRVSLVAGKRFQDQLIGIR
jgi:hypothetical protein